MNRITPLKMFVFAGVLCVAAIVGGAAKVQAATDLTAELQKMVGDLSPEQQSALLLLLTELRGGAAGGAAEGASAGAQSPEAALKANVDKLIQAAKDNNLDAIMNLVSDDFDYYQVGDKEALRGFIQGAMDAGYIEMYIDDVEVNLEDAEIEEESGEFTIYPIEIGGPFGSITVEIVAVVENGEYKVKTLDVYGI